ncbi:hypothetical protein PR048_013127 [Dryococelus australis]|uniref:RNA-directed DNA polymerase n=1 Tax=Dryococelus australis TaxID=614101 RepID=A0ABQ9HST3_9NEOP|nr:hypothetical protein PR048_013127 [Dryococelus australis]
MTVSLTELTLPELYMQVIEAQQTCPYHADTQTLNVPCEVREFLLEHDKCSKWTRHPGAIQIQRNAQKYFYWPVISNDVCHFLCECIQCNCLKSHHSDGMQQQVPHTIALDLMCSYPPTGKLFRVIVTDLFIRWVEMYPVHSMHAKNISKVFEIEFLPQIFPLHGRHSTFCST